MYSISKLFIAQSQMSRVNEKSECVAALSNGNHHKEVDAIKDHFCSCVSCLD